MPKITYISADGDETTLDVPIGMSLMEAATTNDVEGIVAECGGNAMCATCHVYVDPERMGDLPDMMDFEDAMLEETICPRETNSRLSCQLPASDALEGLRLRLPEAQI